MPAARGPDAASDAQRNGSRLSFMQRLQDARSRFRPLASSHSRRNLVPLHELLRATRPRDAFHERPHAENHFRICEDLRNQKARVIGRETVESSGVVRLAQASELPSEVFDEKARERTRTSAENLSPFQSLSGVITRAQAVRGANKVAYGLSYPPMGSGCSIWEGRIADRPI